MVDARRHRCTCSAMHMLELASHTLITYINKNTMSMQSYHAKIFVRPASRLHWCTKWRKCMSGCEAPRGHPPYRDVTPAAGTRDRRCAGCLSYRVQRSPCRHSESDCFVSCFVRAGPVFFAIFFHDEHNAPDDRALSWREMSTLHRMTWWCVESTGLKHLWGRDGREGSRCRHIGIPAVEARHLSTTCAISCTAPTDGGIFPCQLLS
jgi:hypothetical protein